MSWKESHHRINGAHNDSPRWPAAYDQAARALGLNITGMYAGTALSTICGSPQGATGNQFDHPDVLFEVAQELLGQHTPVILPANDSAVTLIPGLYYAVINATGDSDNNKM